MKNWIAHVKKAHAPKRSVIGEIKANVGGFEQPRSHETLHASDLTDAEFCPRETALLHETGKVRAKRFIPTAMQVTFDVGNATADLVKERWLGPSSVGHWECRRCKALRLFTVKPPERDSAIDCQHDWKYIEVRFQGSHGASCGVDALVNIGRGKLTAVELKIIKPEDFDALKAPLAEHQVRTKLYLHLVATSDSPYAEFIHTDEARVLYVSRAYGKANHDHGGEVLPFKEYSLLRDDADLGVQKALATAEQVDRYRTFRIMPVGLCGTHQHTRAKKCSVAKECFSGEFPAGKEIATCEV